MSSPTIRSSARSELLGACQVDVKTVDRILLGNMIEASTDETLYDAWQLYDAVEPKYVQDDAQAGSASPAGLNSALVAKPAPDFRLRTVGRRTISA